MHTFSDNLQRVIMVGEMPLQLMFHTALIERSVCMSRFDCGVAPDDTSKDKEESCKEAFSKRLDAYNKDADWATKTAFEYGSHNLKMLLKPGHPGRAAIEAVLGAMITSAYSAFETLAADLWVATVDMHFELAANVLSDKSLQGNVVAGYGGDISKAGGRVLRDTKKVTLDSLSGIQGAYRQAFKRQLNSVFDKQLRHTEKVRHLIAHRAGLIDQKFKGDMSRFRNTSDSLLGHEYG